jgi:hypothetical protein
MIDSCVEALLHVSSNSFAHFSGDDQFNKCCTMAGDEQIPRPLSDE